MNGYGRRGLGIAGAATAASVAAVVVASGATAGLAVPSCKGKAATIKLRTLLGEMPSVAEDPDAHALPPIEGEIRLDGVTFGYTPDEPVLHDVSLTIAAGETFSLVGPTGKPAAASRRASGVVNRTWRWRRTKKKKSDSRTRVDHDGRQLPASTVTTARKSAGGASGAKNRSRNQGV